jgi:acyl-homoserine lactone acylase PvdQ
VRTEVDRARLRVDRHPAQVAELYPAPAPRPEAFVVSGELTASGLPVLADSLPAAPGIPSPWIQVGLACEDLTPTCPFDASGVTLPGVPGVLAGHNQDVAWGLATSNTDVTDLFLEKMGLNTLAGLPPLADHIPPSDTVEALEETLRPGNT